MNVFVAILGLAFLILIHEAGHFFAALAVGMRPRRFYLGFPPALVKTTRNGIEYGIGAIPLGGYVKIPGMHRPRRRTSTCTSAARSQERPELAGAGAAAEARARRRGRRSRRRGARGAAGASPATIRRRASSAGSRRSSTAFRPHAYWRQATWRRIVVDLRRPGDEPPARGRPVHVPVHGRRRQGDDDRRQRARQARRPPPIGLKPGDQIVAVNGVRRRPDRHLDGDLRLARASR